MFWLQNSWQRLSNFGQRGVVSWLAFLEWRENFSSHVRRCHKRSQSAWERKIPQAATFIKSFLWGNLGANWTDKLSSLWSKRKASSIIHCLWSRKRQMLVLFRNFLPYSKWIEERSPVLKGGTFITGKLQGPRVVNSKASYFSDPGLLL